MMRGSVSPLLRALDVARELDYHDAVFSQYGRGGAGLKVYRPAIEAPCAWVVLGLLGSAAACALDDRDVGVNATSSENMPNGQGGVAPGAGTPSNGMPNATALEGTDPALASSESDDDGSAAGSTGDPMDNADAGSVPTSTSPNGSGGAASEGGSGAGGEPPSSDPDDPPVDDPTGDLPTDPPSDPTPVCSSGREPCDGACVDFSSDSANCGSCNSACGTNERCAGGECTCSGALFPCLVENEVLTVEGYGVYTVAGYRDATHDWVAFAGIQGFDNVLIIRDAAAQRSVRTVPMPDTEVQLVFLPDEPTLLYSSGGTLSRITEQGQPAALMTGVDWFKLSRDGRTIVTLDYSDDLGQEVLALRSFPSLAVQRRLTVSVGLPTIYQTERLALSNDGRWVAMSGLYENEQVQLYDLSSGGSRVLRATGATATYSPVFSEDGSELYVGGGYADGNVYVFSTANGAELRRMKVFENYVNSVVQVPGYRQLLVGGSDGRLAIVDASTGAELWATFTGYVMRSDFSPDGERIYTGVGGGTIGYLFLHSVQ